MTNLITAQDITDFAPDLDVSSYSATTLSGIISQASRSIAKFCNVKGFDLNTYTDTDRARISNTGELVINTRVRPIVSVQSVTLKRGGFSTSLVLTDSVGNPLYQIPDPANRIHIPNSYLYMTGTYLAGGSSQLMALKFASMFVTTTYTAGWSTIPDDLKDACMLWVQDILARRNNREGVQNFSQGSYSVNYNRNATDGDSPTMKEAKTILYQGDYVKVGSF
jgi:hypothetical protein